MGTTVAELTASIRAEGTASAVRNINKVGDAGENTSSRIVNGNRATSESFASTAKSAALVGIAMYSIKKASDALFSAINTAKQFESSISDLSAITGAVGDDLKFLSDKSREFGAVTTLSASQAAEAFKLVASAKPDLLESGEALAQVTKEAIALAEASGSTLPDAAKTLGSSLNQFSEDADQAGRFINVLAAGAKFGASEIADTALALKDSGTVASSAGVSFEELNASIQALSTVSIKGSRAGVGLRNVILKLQTQSKDGLNPAIVGLNKAMSNLAKEQLSTTELTKLFGLENVVVATSLIKMSGNLGELTNKLTGTNVAYDQAATKVDNLEGDLKKLNSAWEEMQLTVVGSTDPMRGAVQGTTDVVLSLTGSMDELAIVGGAVASLLTGRLAKSVSVYATKSIAGVAATHAQTKAIIAQQTTQVAALAVKVSYANATLAEAKAAVAASAGIKRLALAESVLVPAQLKAAAAANAHSTALVSLRSAATGASIAAKGLKSVMAFLGGPVGVIVTAATALAFWAATSKTAAADTNTLSASTDGLSTSLTQFDIATDIKKAREQLKGFQENLKALQETKNVDPRSLASVNAMIKSSTSRIGRLKDQLVELKNKDDDIQSIIAGQGGDNVEGNEELSSLRTSLLSKSELLNASLVKDRELVNKAYGDNIDKAKEKASLLLQIETKYRADVAALNSSERGGIASLSKSLLNERDALASNLADRREMVDAFYGEDVEKAGAKADLLFRIEEDYANKVEALDARGAARNAKNKDNNALQSSIDALQNSLLSKEDLEYESYGRRWQLAVDANEEKLLTDEEFNNIEAQLFSQHQDKLLAIAKKSEMEKQRVRAAGLGAAANVFGGISALMKKEGEKSRREQKAMARASIIMSTAQAVMLALHATPYYPVNVALAAGAALQGAAQLVALNTNNVSAPSVSVSAAGVNDVYGGTSSVAGNMDLPTAQNNQESAPRETTINFNNYGGIMATEELADILLPILQEASDIERLTIEIGGEQAEIRTI